MRFVFKNCDVNVTGLLLSFNGEPVVWPVVDHAAFSLLIVPRYGAAPSAFSGEVKKSFTSELGQWLSYASAKVVAHNALSLVQVKVEAEYAGILLATAEGSEKHVDVIVNMVPKSVIQVT